MDFKHLELRTASMSDQMLKLSIAGERIGAAPDPITELYKLDCVPSEIHALANEVLTAATVVQEVSEEFERTRAALLRKWRGEAADAFAQTSLQLLTSYLARRRSALETGQAGQAIGENLDAVARQAAQDGDRVAGEVEPACDIVITQTDEGLEEAKDAVRAAVAAIQDLVAAKIQEIEDIGAQLDKIGKS